jgi:translocation and assembly module TamB
MGRHIVWLGRIALVIAGLIGLVFVSLLTTSGQRVAIGLASYVATSEHFKLSIGRLDGSLFDSGRLAHITIGDRKGTWLDVRNIRFTWSVLSLLRGHVNVEDIQMGSVDVVRKPLSPDDLSSKSSSSSPPLMRVTLKQLQIEQLILGEVLAGTAARFQIKANAKLIDHRQGLSARLTATRLDRPGARVAAELDFRAVTQSLSVQMSASEPVGGLVATLMRLPDAPAMSMKFSGQGPLDAWQAKWSVSASEQPFVTGRVRLDRIADRHRLATDFAGYVQHIVPTGIAELMSGKTTGSLIGFFTGLDRFDASQIALASDTLQLKGGGGFVPALSYAYGSVSVRIAGKDERPVAIAVSKDDRVSVRKLNFRATVPDVQTVRDISFDVAVKGLVHKLGALSKIELTSRMTQSHPVGSGAWAADRVALQVKTHGLSSPMKGLVEAIGTLGQLDLTGSLKSGELAIDRLRIGDDTTHLVGTGHLSQSGYAGTAKLTIDDLRRFSGLYGQPIAGRLGIAAKSSVGRDGGTSVLTFNGAAKDLALGQGALARLLGTAAEVSGELARDASGRIRLRRFDAAGANVTVAAHGRYAEAKIELDHSAEVRDLSALQNGLVGAGKLEVRLRGTQHDLASKIQISTQNSSWRGHKIKGLVLSFEGKGPVSTHSGLFAVDGSIGRQKLFSKARLTLGSSGMFAAQGLELGIGRNKLAGAMRVAPGETPSGNFTLDATQLSDLEVLIGQKISGALQGSIELSEKQQQPFINAHIEAPSIRIGGNSLKGLKGAAALKNYLTGVNGAASLTLANLRATG